jgi:hypothetical protein
VPRSWQGWALVAGYALALVADRQAARHLADPGLPAGWLTLAAALPLTAGFLALVHRHTRGLGRRPTLA